MRIKNGKSINCPEDTGFKVEVAEHISNKTAFI
jgi:hypothetical protein